jgi:hypothetical protein
VDAVNESCCCDHKHTNDCLWFKYLKKSEDDLAQAHSLHSKPCACKKTQCIDHTNGCSAYSHFFHKLIEGFDGNEGTDNLELVSLNINKQGYLRFPAKGKAKINKMCCCSSHLPHDES